MCERIGFKSEKAPQYVAPKAVSPELPKCGSMALAFAAMIRADGGCGRL